MTASAPHRVAVLVRTGVLPMELGLVHQLFGQARSAEGQPLYQVLTCTPVPGQVPTAADFPIHVEHGLELLATAGTVLVPASHADDQPPDPPDEALAATLRALAALPERTRIVSICTGAFVLAAAGLLHGRRATTHWKSAERFRLLHPGVELDPDVLYLDQGRVLTSAGEAAGVDLCLHLIRQDHGAAVANEVARTAVVPPHRDGGQAQFIPQPVPEPDTPGTGPARDWALAHLDQPMGLGELAARAAMSRRTFTRRFRAEVGMSPAQWLIRQRVERARRLLEETDLPVDRVAADAGFGTAASLRLRLRQELGVSPSSYRGTFRGPARTG